MEAEHDTRTHILIVDDHDRIREGIRDLVQQHEDLHVIGEAGDGATAVELARRLRPHIILMDFVMPVMDGARATQLIIRDLPQTKIIGFSSIAAAEKLMLASGAFIFFEKSNITDELQKALKRAVYS
jgi:NarL family two-component system response regulator LiaR